MKHLKTMKHLRIVASVVGVSILLALVSCGGGGGGGSTPVGPPGGNWDTLVWDQGNWQ
jgi:hypothetical protein